MEDVVIYRLLKVLHEVYWHSSIPLRVHECDIAWSIVQSFNRMHDLPGKFVMNIDNGHWHFKHVDGRTLKSYGVRWYKANTGLDLDPAMLGRPND